MLSTTQFVLLSIAWMAIFSTAKPMPNPRDLVRDGCQIEQDKNGHWPLHIWADVLGVKPDPDCSPAHSWCDLYSMEPSLEKAQKDCAKFLKDMREELKKVGR